MIRWLLRLYLVWMKKRMEKRGIDYASSATIKERDNLVECGEALGSDEEIRKLMVLVPWETYCEWREDYRKRKHHA